MLPMKDSARLRSFFRGEEALREFSEIKTVTLKLPQLQNLSFKSNAAKQYAAPVLAADDDDCHKSRLLAAST